MEIEDLVEYADGTMFLVLVPIGILIGLAMQRWAGSSFYRVCSRIGEVPSKCGLNGHDIATRLLAAGGLSDVRVKRDGTKNCYHPWKREIRLQSETFDSGSLFALASVAHEVGHAQHFGENTWRCRFYLLFWPACWALLCLTAGYAVLSLLGFVPSSQHFLGLGIVVVTCAVVVALQMPISLPLEADATQRGRKLARACLPGMRRRDLP